MFTGDGFRRSLRQHLSGQNAMTLFNAFFATILEKGNVSGQVFVEDPTQQQDSVTDGCFKFDLWEALFLKAKKNARKAVCIESLQEARKKGMFPN